MAFRVKVRKPNKTHCSLVLPLKDVLLSLCTWARNRIGRENRRSLRRPLSFPRLPGAARDSLRSRSTFPLQALPRCHSAALHSVPNTLKPPPKTGLSHCSFTFSLTDALKIVLHFPHEVSCLFPTGFLHLLIGC